jgi:hypothetical protein
VSVGDFEVGSTRYHGRYLQLPTRAERNMTCTVLFKRPPTRHRHQARWLWIGYATQVGRGGRSALGGAALLLASSWSALRGPRSGTHHAFASGACPSCARPRQGRQGRQGRLHRCCRWLHFPLELPLQWMPLAVGCLRQSIPPQLRPPRKGRVQGGSKLN